MKKIFQFSAVGVIPETKVAIHWLQDGPKQSKYQNKLDIKELAKQEPNPITQSGNWTESE